MFGSGVDPSRLGRHLRATASGGLSSPIAADRRVPSTAPLRARRGALGCTPLEDWSMGGGNSPSFLLLTLGRPLAITQIHHM